MLHVHRTPGLTTQLGSEYNKSSSTLDQKGRTLGEDASTTRNTQGLLRQDLKFLLASLMEAREASVYQLEFVTVSSLGTKSCESCRKLVFGAHSKPMIPHCKLPMAVSNS